MNGKISRKELKKTRTHLSLSPCGLAILKYRKVIKTGKRTLNPELYV